MWNGSCPPIRRDLRVRAVLADHTVHRTWARQKVFIRRVIELAGLDFTIIPAGLWPDYYMLEPVRVMGDPDRKVSWSTGRHHPARSVSSAFPQCDLSGGATAYCSWNELLAIRESALGREVARNYLTSEPWKAFCAGVQGHAAA